MNENRHYNRPASSQMVLVDKPKTTVAWNKIANSCFCVPGIKQFAHRAGLSMSGLREDGGLLEEWSSPNHHLHKGAYFDDDCSSILSDMTGSETFSCLSSDSDDDEDQEPMTICWSSTFDDRKAAQLSADRSSATGPLMPSTFEQKMSVLNELAIATPRERRSKPRVSPLPPEKPTLSIANNTSHHTSSSNISCGSRTFVVTDNASFLSIPSASSSITDPHRNRGRSYTGDDSSTGQQSLGNGSVGSLHRRTLPLGIHHSDTLRSEEPKGVAPKLPPLPPRNKPPQSLSLVKKQQHRRSDTDVSALEIKGFGSESGNEENSDSGDIDKGRRGKKVSKSKSSITTTSNSPDHKRKRRATLSSSETHRKPPKQPYASCDHLKATDFLWKNSTLESTPVARAATMVLSGWIVVLFGTRAAPSGSAGSTKSIPGPTTPQALELVADDLYYLRILEQPESDYTSVASAVLVLHRSIDGKPVHSFSIQRNWILRSLELGDRRMGRSVLLSVGQNTSGQDASEAGDSSKENIQCNSSGWIRMIPVALKESWRSILDRRMEEHAHQATRVIEKGNTDENVDANAATAIDPATTQPTNQAITSQTTVNASPKKPRPLRGEEPKSLFVLPSHGRFAPDAQLDTTRHLYFTIDSFVKQQQQ